MNEIIKHIDSNGRICELTVLATNVFGEHAVEWFESGEILAGQLIIEHDGETRLIDSRDDDEFKDCEDELWVVVNGRWKAKDEIDEHNADVLKEYFEDQEKWIMEYVQSDDYVDNYAYLMGESNRINESVKQLLKEETLYYWRLPAELFDDMADNIATEILQNGQFDFHVVDEYSSECVGYLDSFEIGEYEEQIEVSRVEEDLEDKIIGDVVDALEEWIPVQRDFCIADVGGLRGKYPTTYLIVNTGLRIDFVVDDDFPQIVSDEVVRQCQTTDNKTDQARAELLRIAGGK